MVNRNRFIGALFVFMLPSILLGQQLWNTHTTLKDSSSMSLEVIAEGYSNSNALTNAFFFGFVNGRFVNDDEKDIIQNRSWSTNRFGQDAS